MKVLPSVVKLSLIAIVLVGGFGFVHSDILARSSDDVGEEIDAQKAQLNNVNAQLAAAQKELSAANSQLGNASGQVAQLQAEINQIQAELKVNQLKLESLNAERQLSMLEHESIKLAREQLLLNSYMAWRSSNELQNSGFGWLGGGLAANVKQDTYRNSLLATKTQDLIFVSEKIDDLNTNIAAAKDLAIELERQTKELTEKKARVEAELAALQLAVNSRSSAVAGLRAQAGTIQRNINLLSAEQRALQEYENSLLSQGGNGGQQEVASGQYYFFGKGRDLYQGHGVGMSQFGAYGAAAQGWSAAQILQKYYTNTSIKTAVANINVQGYGTMTADAYVAGLGEVPDKACGSAEQIAARPDKYTSDNPNTIWDCWPEESIKAQVIAARTYAIFQGGTICTNANCQIYKGGNAKQWAADETSNMVIVSNAGTHANGIISAVYSSDNSQGYGTADNDTVFSDMNGNGTPHTYLRAVNDTAWAKTTSYTNWSWRTDGFDIARMNRFLTHGATHGGLSSSARSFMASLKSTVGGEVAFMSFERDPSNRVKKVIITGTNGQSKAMAGWLFKTVWNSWVAAEQPNGSVDYIYSLTFFLAKAE